jgi:hypothetical protein
MGAQLEMSRRNQKMAAQIGAFRRQYHRTSQGGMTEPNDRQYGRKVERKLKRMKPEELDELLHGEDIQPGQPLSSSSRCGIGFSSFSPSASFFSS